MIFGIVAAAGSGNRLSLPCFKCEVPLSGKPLFYYSLSAFENSRLVEGVVLVLPGERLGDWSRERLLTEGFSKVMTIVPGGVTRQQSVFSALEKLPAEVNIVVVHDGARPLVSSLAINSVCDIPEGFDGLITAIRVTDTVKEVDNSRVVKTLDRDRLVSVQTPQAFLRSRLYEAHKKALEKGFEGSDDASLIEFIGGKVGVIQGDRHNIKVTYPEDLVIVERLLNRGGTNESGNRL